MKAQSPVAWLQHARECARRGDVAGALRAYAKAAAVPQTLAAAAREGAHLGLSRGAADVAARLLEHGLRAEPASAELHALVAVLGRMRGDFPAALAAAGRALALDRAEPVAAGIIADLALMHGAPTRALSAVEVALARHPRNAVLWRDKGRAHLDRGEPAAASAALGQAFSLNAADPSTRSNLALASLYDASLNVDAVRGLHLRIANAAQSSFTAPPFSMPTARDPAKP